MKPSLWISLLAIFILGAGPLAGREENGPLPGQREPAAGGYYEGQLLVADPKMPDPRFQRTVIFLCKHDSTGAFGLVLNRPANPAAAQKILDVFGLKPAAIKSDLQLRFGGPVQPGSAFLLHSNKFGGDTQICNQHGLAITSNKETLDTLTTESGPNRSILFIGYAGWGPNQLEAELDENSWVIAPADREILFDRETGSLWERMLAKRVIDL